MHHRWLSCPGNWVLFRVASKGEHGIYFHVRNVNGNGYWIKNCKVHPRICNGNERKIRQICKTSFNWMFSVSVFMENEGKFWFRCGVRLAAVKDLLRNKFLSMQVRARISLEEVSLHHFGAIGRNPVRFDATPQNLLLKFSFAKMCKCHGRRCTSELHRVIERRNLSSDFYQI